MNKVRKFNATDQEYSTIVALYNDLWPDERQFSAERLRENDEEWPADFLYQRFVLEVDGQIAGFGGCFEQYWQPQLGTVHIEFHVNPAYSGEHWVKQLYDGILVFLRQLEAAPQVTATRAREDRHERVTFLLDQGYRSAMRFPRSSLKVADFDAQRFRGLSENLATEGIRIYTLAQLQRGDSSWKQKLYELRWAIIQDVPAVEAPTKWTMAEFQERILADPALEEEAWFIAIDDIPEGMGLWVGMSNLWLNDPSRKRLDTGLTGCSKLIDVKA